MSNHVVQGDTLPLAAYSKKSYSDVSSDAKMFTASVSSENTILFLFCKTPNIYSTMFCKSEVIREFPCSPRKLNRKSK